MAPHPLFPFPGTRGRRPCFRVKFPEWLRPLFPVGLRPSLSLPRALRPRPYQSPPLLLHRGVRLQQRHLLLLLLPPLLPLRQ